MPLHFVLEAQTWHPLTRVPGRASWPLTPSREHAGNRDPFLVPSGDHHSATMENSIRSMETWSKLRNIMCIQHTWIPTENRFTPANVKSFRLAFPAGVGFTSRVTSASSERWACLETVSKTAEIVEGWARLGVPPPKNTELILHDSTELKGYSSPKNKHFVYPHVVPNLYLVISYKKEGNTLFC